MNMKFDLTIEQTQKLNLTQEMVQAIKILQLNSTELERYVDEQVLANPVLEKDLIVRENYSTSTGFRKEKPQGTPFKQFNLNEETLSEHLLHQLQFVKAPKGVIRVCEYLIDTLDDNGYLKQSIDEIAEIENCSGETVHRAIRVLRSFEPAGVGARNIPECLLLQLKAKGSCSNLKARVIKNHLEELALNRLQQIAKANKTSVETIQKISDEIKTLDPKPGRAFASSEETRYITPDVYLEEVNGEYKLTLSESSKPGVAVNQYYMDLLEGNKDNEELTDYLLERIKAARWLIDSIEQRRNTIYNVSKAIVDYQEEFFSQGEKHLKPLILRQIAEQVNVHESTVSRTINGKYIQTPRGVFELKYFFTSGVSGRDGEDVSSKAIKEMIKELVDNEDPKKPISDQKIAEHLVGKGIDIARRTVAKYREEIGIFSSQKRKRY
ncbi:MAG: RNA polymerase factor sigma-54 [Eubacterium sp.]|nr:RNA polymerase factor sigma-54 [Candidatus Colimonas fimequi]